MDGDLTLGMLVAFQSLLSSFLQPVNQLVSFGSAIQEISADIDRLEDVERYRLDPCFDEKRVRRRRRPAARRLSGQIELRNVTFGYNRLAEPLIDGLQPDAAARHACRPGRRFGQRQMHGGQAGGRSVSRRGPARSSSTASRGTPSRASGWRTRSPWSIRTSSCSRAPSATTSLWDTTWPTRTSSARPRDACIHEDIAARGGGYDSTVEEGGRNFSGGQRQRLEIARALVNQPSILVLDEATSALDPHTEQRVDDNLRRRGCTCLIVAHRLSTIRDCDEILVLERGVVVQRGTHDELARADGAYARLIRAE